MVNKALVTENKLLDLLILLWHMGHKAQGTGNKARSMVNKAHSMVNKALATVNKRLS